MVSLVYNKEVGRWETPPQPEVEVIETNCPFSWKELIATSKRDSKDASFYMKHIEFDTHLRAMIKKNRCPLIIFYSDNNCHIIFPPSEMISKRKNNQMISRLPFVDKGDDLYVSHTTSKTKKGPRCICSYAIVNRSEANRLKDRVIKILESEGLVDQAEKYKSSSSAINFYS